MSGSKPTQLPDTNTEAYLGFCLRKDGAKEAFRLLIMGGSANFCRQADEQGDKRERRNRVDSANVNAQPLRELQPRGDFLQRERKEEVSREVPCCMCWVDWREDGYCNGVVAGRCAKRYSWRMVGI